MMHATAIAALFSVIIWCVAALANWKLRVHDRLPVQYMPGVGVLQTIPRRIALFSLPVGLVVFYLAYLILRYALHLPLRSRASASSDLKGIGIVFSAAEFVYALAVARTLRKTTRPN